VTGPRGHPLRHLAGLALVIGLLALCWGLWLWMPGWLRGTPLQELSLLVTFAAWVGVLTAAEWLIARIFGTGH
jgi:hypothetical protein